MNNAYSVQQNPPRSYDANADEFNFSFGTFSGTFYYTANGWQAVSNEPNIKVQELGFMEWGEITSHVDKYNLNTVGIDPLMEQSRMFRGFIITTPDGAILCSFIN
jgi:hypothetical protein